MAIFIPHENVEHNLSFGQAINKAKKEYIEPELKRRNITGFRLAGIEILSNRTNKIYLDDEVRLIIEFKKRKIDPKNEAKLINIDLHEIKNVEWDDKKIDKNSTKILVVRFNKNWWIWSADFKSKNDLEKKFRVTRTFKIRGGGYMPLNMRRRERKQFMEDWQTELAKELPAMWQRHITISQRYRGAIVYDGNYFDIFSHAQELYILGYYYSSIIICRIAAEQALISILTKSGKAFDIYKQVKGKRKLKSIEQLTETCRSYSLFSGKYPVNKMAAAKLNEISTIAGELVHLKHDLGELNIYKKEALKCMDNLQYIIKNHLNFIKDTGIVSGYRLAGSAQRLK